VAGDRGIGQNGPMLIPNRFDLIGGRYSTPKCRIGQLVECEVRGTVRIVGLTDAKIPWPIGSRRGARSLVVYKVLERAIRMEASQAITHWWGASMSAVRTWRRALDVGPMTPGTRRLHQAYGGQINAGKKLKPETRRKLSQIHLAKGSRPRNGTKDWTPEEDHLLATLPAGEVAELTGRSLKAVYSRRVRLGMPDGRRR
jgi:hypothetical protein